MFRYRIAIAILFATCQCAIAVAAEPKKQIVIVAGLKSHGPEGNGIHDYGWSARLIKTLLENSNVREQVDVTIHLAGWPSDLASLQQADTVMVISDGRDGDKGREAPHLATAERVRQMDELTAGGCGLVTFHFSTFAPDSLADKVLDWTGGYFDWETDGRRQWYSKISTINAIVSPASPGHPVLRGVRPFKIKEEFYYDIRFRDDDPGWRPIWNVEALPATKPHGDTVGWAVQREGGRRGFSTTCGHFYDNWMDDNFRKTILNALAWTAHLEVPPQGIESEYQSRTQIAHHLQQLDALPDSPDSAQDEDAYADEPYWYKPGHPLNPAEPRSIKTLPGFEVTRVYRIPEEYGSWTALTRDDRGRLICAAQHKAGLYRLTLDGDGVPSVEKLAGVAEQVGWSHGLLYAFDSLYITITEGNDRAEGGVYRLRDTDGDDQFDELNHLLEFNLAGEHGPHNIVVGPDGKSLYMMCGNGTRLPEGIEQFLPSETEGVDHLMPPGFESSQYTPAGFVIRFDPDGSNRQLMGGGLRNSFDLAFNEHGDLFTFDSDMEWDLGAPWYRPTRICHFVPGAEFGWRGDAAKWPEYFEDSCPPVVNVGPASPSGVTFGYGAKYPAKYQRALFACDWTFATIHAIHLEPRGATYHASVEEFVGGSGLPVTDLVIGADGAMYFLVGGRRLGSALYRVSYVGDDSTAAAVKAKVDRTAARAHADRKRIEAYLGKQDSMAVEAVWPYLGNPDRSLRFTARVALEAQPVESWRQRAIDEAELDSRLVALLALARREQPRAVPQLLEKLREIDLRRLTVDQMLIALRATELALARGADRIGVQAKAELAEKLRTHFPHGDWRVNRELARLLCYLGDHEVIDRLLAYMARDEGARPVLGSGYFVRNPKYGQAVRDILQAAPLVDRMHTAQMMLWLDDDWSKDQRARFFELIADAKQNTKGGYWYGQFWDRISEVALDQTPEAWREEMERIVSDPAATSDSELPSPQGPGEEWTLQELMVAAGKSLRNRDFANGQKMFAAAKCVTCHRFQGTGNATGPDLSSLAQRFTIRDILDSTLHPSKAISDQYRVTMLTTSDGRTISGRIVARNNDSLVIATNLNRPSQTSTIELDEIEWERLTPVSTMPDGLLNPLNLDEVLDLLAYLISGGDALHPVFARSDK